LYIAEHTYSFGFAGQARIGDNVHTDRSTPNNSYVEQPSRHL